MEVRAQAICSWGECPRYSGLSVGYEPVGRSVCTETTVPRLARELRPGVGKLASTAGQDRGIWFCQYVSAMLYNGLGRYEEALAHAQEASVAREMFEAMGMEGFSERARRELRATGERARRRDVTTQGELTPQEAQTAKLAAEGLSNSEIGTRLFISGRTAEYHLGKVFTKLNITARSQLQRALS